MPCFKNYLLQKPSTESMCQTAFVNKQVVKGAMSQIIEQNEKIRFLRGNFLLV